MKNMLYYYDRTAWNKVQIFAVLHNTKLLAA